MSSQPIKNVVVVGGSGNVGQVIVRELLNAGFMVTVLTREGGSGSTLPEGAKSKAVDYASVESLTAALKGQDAVISTVATTASAVQHALVDAAFAAGVRRFIPSEFGINTRFLGSPETNSLAKILQGKVQTLNYIHEKSKQKPSFSWTAISTGLWFDWGLPYGSVSFDKTKKTAVLHDSGNEKFQASNIGDIGKAVAGVLQHPERTYNRYLTIASFNPTQNQILEIVERLSGGEKWSVERVKTEDQTTIGEEKLAKGDYTAFGHFLRKRLYADGIGLAVEGPDNALDLLGVVPEDLEATLKAWLEN